MSYTFLLVQGGESSAESFSDIALSALLKSNRITEQSYLPGNVTESCLGSPSGTTCEPLMGGHGEGSCKQSAVDSHARTSVHAAKGLESLANQADYGKTWRESSVKYDRETSSWKTLHSLFSEVLQPSSLTLPRWGMMLNGALWARTPPGYCTSAKGSGLLPTPKASLDGTSPKTLAMVLRGDAEQSLPRLMKMLGLTLQPSFAEWLMGWPIGWTDCSPLEMDKFHQWLQSHGANAPLCKSNNPKPNEYDFLQ
jgi:hypothetical protein